MPDKNKKPPSNIMLIKEFFGMSAKTAMDELKACSPADKEQLAGGIRDGSLTY